MFLRSGTGLLAKPVGKVGKTVVAKRVTRRRKPPSSLSNVPEDSILEILEETNTCVKMESSYNLRKDNKMRLVRLMFYDAFTFPNQFSVSKLSFAPEFETLVIIISAVAEILLKSQHVFFSVQFFVRY